MPQGTMTRCEGHPAHNDLGGTVRLLACHRAARLIGFPDGTTWYCGEDKPLIHRNGRVGQQKQKRG